MLEIDGARVGAPIRVEAALPGGNGDGGGEQFPHIYGPLDIDAVTAVHDLRRDAGGWRFTDPT